MTLFLRPAITCCTCHYSTFLAEWNFPSSMPTERYECHPPLPWQFFLNYGWSFISLCSPVTAAISKSPRFVWRAWEVQTTCAHEARNEQHLALGFRVCRPVGRSKPNPGVWKPSTVVCSTNCWRKLGRIIQAPVGTYVYICSWPPIICSHHNRIDSLYIYVYS